jgi:hypothetical protein
MNIVVAKIKKNGFEDVWVTLTDFGGRNRLDIRSYVRGDNGPTPTTKGVAFELSSLKDLECSLEDFAKGLRSKGDIATILTTKRGELRAYKQDYLGHALFHIRWFYRNEAGEMKPGKGVAINEDLLSNLIEAIRAARRSDSFPKADTDHKTA